MTAVTERATATVERVSITEPGVYTLDDVDYFRARTPGPCLSASGAKKLLPPSCPAKFRYEQDHGQPHKDTFDVGHAAHALILGVGAPVVVVDADDWRGKAAREQKAEAHAAGRTPVLAAQWQEVQDMAAALREHPIAAALLHPDSGQPEQSLFWQDSERDLWRKARVDWLPQPRANGTLILTDYKTAQNVDPGNLSRSAALYGYAQQAAWYMDGAAALELADPDLIRFVFVAQEKTAPYLVNVYELDEDALRVGRERNAEALDLFRVCTDSDFWPGYGSPDQIDQISLPGWFTRQHDERF